MKTEPIEYGTLTYDDSQEAKERIFELCLKAFKKLGHFNGESLCQSDNTYIEAPDILTRIAEKGFRFKTKYTE
jgi:hypothetical protein